MGLRGMIFTPGTAAVTEWTRRCLENLHTTSAGGAYINFMMEDEGDGWIRASDRGNYDRLSQIKKRHDPDNFSTLTKTSHRRRRGGAGIRLRVGYSDSAPSADDAKTKLLVRSG